MRQVIALAALSVSALYPVAAQEHAAHGEKLGTANFPTTCKPAVASEFNRAVALLHSFEFGASIRGFDGVLSRDSTCAMAYWGLAMSIWTNPFQANARPQAQLATGARLLEKARGIYASASGRERAYIDAVSLLYTDGVDQRVRYTRYQEAMGRIADTYASDDEAQAFYALALAASAPPSDKTYANQLKAGRILASLGGRHPDHPGVIHYTIHTYDVPALAQQGAAAARSYADIAPSAAHALHMPSHIFTRIGSWEESIATNLRSRATAERDGSLGEALHASDYAMYAYLQMGRDSAARATMLKARELAAKFDANAIGSGASGPPGTYAIAAIPARWTLERQDWKEAASLAVNRSNLPWTDAITWFSRALGAAHMRDFAAARTSIDSLTAIRDRLRAANEMYWAEQVDIQRLGASAWLAFLQGDRAGGIDVMVQATTREDATEKSAVTPGPLLPARELLADMYMAMNQPANAEREYVAVLGKEPGRLRALLGAARSARAAGDTAAASRYEGDLHAVVSKADKPLRPELRGY